MKLQPPRHGQGHLALDHATQDSIQPGLEHCQGLGIHNLSNCADQSCSIPGGVQGQAGQSLG